MDLTTCLYKLLSKTKLPTGKILRNPKEVTHSVSLGESRNLSVRDKPLSLNSKENNSKEPKSTVDVTMINTL